MNPTATIELFASLDAVVFEADAATLRVTFAAGGALARLGISSAECAGDAQLLTERLHADDRAPFLALLRAVASDGRERSLEHRLVAVAGQERWFRSELRASDDGARLVGLMSDVTDARRAAEALQAAQAQLRHVITSAPVIIMTLDRHGTFTVAEGRGLSALGYESSAVVGKNIFEVWGEEPGVLEHVRRALGGEAFTAYDHVRSFGSWWETHWTPLTDDHGRPCGASAVAVDITERERAEDASAQSASLLRATLEATADGILVVDGDGHIVDYNQRFAELWQIPPEVLDARQDEDAISYAVEQLRDPAGFLDKVRALYADPDAISHDVIEFRDGRIFERDSRPQLVGGQPVGRVWCFRDVTVERRATRRATFLAAASKLLAAPLEDITPLDVIARMTVPWLCDWCNIVLVDDDGQPRSAAAYHPDPAKIPLLRRLHPDLRKTFGVAHVIVTGEAIIDNDLSATRLAAPLACSPLSVATEEQAEILRSLGVRARMAVPLEARGQIIGAIVFASMDERRRYDHDDLRLAMDLGQRAALAIDNQRLYQASKQAVALRDEFLSIASHELRTPVTSLQLAVQGALAVGTTGPAEFLARALGSAVRQTRRLGRLVDALLDVSRIQAGRLELQREPADLGAIVREAAAALGEDASRAGCQMQLAVDDGVVGSWDRVRLDQVVTNLLSNAIKYGAGAPIHVAVRAANGRARLTVRDEGIGVPSSEQRRIFERFERAVSAKHYGGLGLGLYIVRSIIEAHGGAISVENAPPTGAQFVVELPR